MSELPTPGNLSGETSMGFRASGVLSALYERTKRYVRCDHEFKRAQEWARRTADERLTDAFTFQIREELQKARLMPEQSLPCFRGRTPPFKAKVPTVQEMGPGDGTNDKNRYSRQGRPDLYLSDSVNGVLREFERHDGDLWLQDYVLPAAQLRIADLTPEGTEPSFSQILWFADLGGEEGQPDRVGQEVSEFARKMFDGILVPGVHGDEHFVYHNIVMFEPQDRWEAWLKPDAEPRKIKG